MNYTVQNIENSYYPFGSQMPGRTYSPNDYRFGYQGSEKDFDVNQGAYTTHFRMLDTRLGRWFSIDPVTQPHQSPFNSMDNSPIWFNDIFGDKIKNGDKIVADKQEKIAKIATKRTTNFKLENNIFDGMKRKEFIKNGGDKNIWKKARLLTQYSNHQNYLAKIFSKRAKITQGIIKRWEKSSPLLFKDVDSQDVDFVLFSKDAEELTKQGVGGYNTVSYTGTPKNPTLISQSAGIKNAQTIVIADDVNLSSVDNGTNQYNLNHEAGHFLYIVKFTSKYIQFTLKQKMDRISTQGGHSKGDKSGSVAEEFGKHKDIPNASNNITP